MIILFCCCAMLVLLSFWISDQRTQTLRRNTKKAAAMQPPVDKNLLRKTPESGDVVLGKYKKKYVCTSMKNDAHFLIVGGSGSGKSSCIVLPTLLCDAEYAIFAVDIKGELTEKSGYARKPDTCIFNPQRRETFGYDPFFLLSEQSTDQQIFETMQAVAFSLIPLSAAIKDPFWKQSARNLLIGLMLYFYKNGSRDLITIIDQILGAPVQQTLQKALRQEAPGSIAYKYLIQFHELAEETLSGIFAETANALVVFSTDADIRYAMRENPRKFAPSMLEDGHSIFLVIREEKLAAYSCILKLIINQTLGELEKRPENAAPILFLIDELARILSSGKLEKLLDAVKTLRSRHVRLMLVTQSMEALAISYGENEVSDLAANCNYKIILDSSSSKTSKQVVEWAGQYRELRQSKSDGSKSSSTTTSYEDKNILAPADLMQLVRNRKAIVISPYGYNMIDKCPYYQDEYFKTLSENQTRGDTIESNI